MNSAIDLVRPDFEKYAISVLSMSENVSSIFALRLYTMLNLPVIPSKNLFPS